MATYARHSPLRVMAASRMRGKGFTSIPPPGLYVVHPEHHFIIKGPFPTRDEAIRVLYRLEWKFGLRISIPFGKRRAEHGPHIPGIIPIYRDELRAMAADDLSSPFPEPTPLIGPDLDRQGGGEGQEEK